jgi:hypothetical protein
MVFLIIQSYLKYKTWISKFVGFDPKLVDIGQFVQAFSLFSVFSIYAESTFKVKVIK